MADERKPDRVRESEMCGNKRLMVVVPNSKPSWKRYGEGSASVEFTFYQRARDGAGCVGIVAEETSFASKLYDEKRDVTKTAMVEIDRAAAEQLYRLLGETFGFGEQAA